MRKASAGIQDLIRRTSGPEVTATVTVDQVYAKYQHESLDLQHPRGGRAKYLEAPLYENRERWLQRFADRLLRSRENVAHQWAGLGRSLVAEVAREAPVEFGDLRASGGLVVREGAEVVLEEPAVMHRLSEEEIRAKRGFLRGD